MPVPQHSPAPAVSWPVLSGPMPPLAASYSHRPETGFGAVSGQPAEQSTSVIRAEETGSYVLAGPPGTGKTQLAVAYSRSLWQSRDIELLVWIPGSSRAAILNGYAQAYYDTSRAAGGPAVTAGPGSVGAAAGQDGALHHPGPGLNGSGPGGSAGAAEEGYG